MDEVLTLAGELARALKNCPELEAYRLAKNAVLSDPGLARRLAAYKEASFSRKMRVASGEIPSFDEEKILSGVYSGLILNDTAREFLEREEAVYSLVNGINGILGEVYAELDTDRPPGED